MLMFMCMYVHLYVGACGGQGTNLGVIPQELSPLTKSESFTDMELTK